MTEHRHIIAILRGILPAEIADTVQALIDAGITRIEVPLNSPDAFTSIKIATARYGEEAVIGAGTVLSPGEVDNLKSCGGQFVVSPNCDPAVIARTIELRLESYPGVFTPTECFAALRAGATGLKIFPAELCGPSGIKAMKAVLPADVSVYAVGGADPGNFAEYFAAGCAGFGLGSYLFKPGFSAGEVAERAKKAVRAYDEGKPS